MNSADTIFWAEKALMKIYSSIWMNHNVHFDDAIPTGPCILAANHPTTTDPFLLSLLIDRPLSIPITGMAFEVPVFGRILRAAGHIAVDKVNPGKQDVVGQAVQRLAAGQAIGIFPEGALSPSIGSFYPPHSGAARMALLSGAPVMAVGIYLSENAVLEKQLATDNYTDTARIVVRGDYFVTVGKAKMYCGDANDYSAVRQVSRQIMADIAEQTRQSRERMLLQPAKGFIRSALLGISKAWGTNA